MREAGPTKPKEKVGPEGRRSVIWRAEMGSKEEARCPVALGPRPAQDGRRREKWKRKTTDKVTREPRWSWIGIWLAASKEREAALTHTRTVQFLHSTARGVARGPAGLVDRGSHGSQSTGSARLLHLSSTNLTS